jgi:catechol 2,3-dioxygenase-like lactoylglutathione lyase family enzyme
VRLEGLRWLGITTDRPEAMIGFLHDVLGLHIEFEEPTTTELSLPTGDRVQVFAPGNPYHDRYRSQGVVPLFEVEDVRAAMRDLEEAGLEVGDLDSDATWEWIDVRAPDGRLYVLASRLERPGS